MVSIKSGGGTAISVITIIGKTSIPMGCSLESSFKLEPTFLLSNVELGIREDDAFPELLVFVGFSFFFLSLFFLGNWKLVSALKKMS